MVFLALTPLLASAAGTVRIQRAYVKLFDHLLHLYVKPRILGGSPFTLIRSSGTPSQLRPTRKCCDNAPGRGGNLCCRHGWHDCVLRLGLHRLHFSFPTYDFLPSYPFQPSDIRFQIPWGISFISGANAYQREKHQKFKKHHLFILNYKKDIKNEEFIY